MPEQPLPKQRPLSATDEFAFSTPRFPDTESHAQWLMAFLRRDLPALDDPRWPETQHGAWEFATIRGALVVPDDDLDGAARPSHSALTRVQEEVRHGIQQVRRNKWWELSEPITYGLAQIGRTLIGGPQRGSFRSLFAQTAMEVIKAEWSRLRTCPHCSHLFIKLGKQAYCAQDCAQTARWDRFKAVRAPRDFHAERQNALRKRHGAHLHVGRKTRRVKNP